MTAGCKLYLTYRTEYLLLRDLCVGVRDRGSSAWLPLHSAACAHLLGPVDDAAASPLIVADARIGERLCFRAPVRRIVTGPVVAIEDPSPSLLLEAERQWQALFRPRDPRHTALTLLSDEDAAVLRSPAARSRSRT
jgi:hypothetical protein